MDMTVEESKHKRQELQNEIWTLIVEYEKVTTMIVDEITLYRENYNLGQSAIIMVSVKVNL